MIYRGVAERLRASAAWCVALLGLAIPISTAADNVLLGLVVCAWLAALPIYFGQWWKSLTAIPPLLVAALLFAALLAGTLYSPVSWKDAASAAFKYVELFLISVLLWAAVSSATRKRALYFFLLAIVLNLIVSYTMANGVAQELPGLRTSPHYPIGFRLSVTHGILVSLGAFICLLLAREARTTAMRAPLIGLAILCAHNVLFIVVGRTGYVVLAALIAYFFVSAMRGWRGLAVSLVLVAAVFTAAYYGSGNFRERTDAIASDVTQWKPGAGDATSVGQRLGYYLTGVQIIAEHPLTGVGTGGFAQAYAEKVRGTEAVATTNPHNDYIMIGAQIGLPGVMLLLLLYGVVWHTARNLASRFERDLARGIVITMAIAGLFNSVLLDHTEGLLFAWATALLYAGYTANKRPHTAYRADPKP